MIYIHATMHMHTNDCIMKELSELIIQKPNGGGTGSKNPVLNVCRLKSLLPFRLSRLSGD